MIRENMYWVSNQVSRTFVYIMVVLVLLCIARAQEVNPQRQVEPMNEQAKKSANSEIAAEELFKKLFFERRKDHLDAVRSLQKIDSYEHLYKMISILTEKVIDVIGTSKSLLEDIGFSPDNSSFPEDVNVRDALSNVLENTALIGDIILHLPDITHKVLKNQPKWNRTIRWSLNFTERAERLLDKSTITMLKLVAQELNITPREPGYFNPYWKQPTVSNVNDSSKKKKSSNKSKLKKEPRMHKIEL